MMLAKRITSNELTANSDKYITEQNFFFGVEIKESIWIMQILDFFCFVWLIPTPALMMVCRKGDITGWLVLELCYRFVGCKYCYLDRGTYQSKFQSKLSSSSAKPRIFTASDRPRRATLRLIKLRQRHEGCWIHFCRELLWKSTVKVYS